MLGHAERILTIRTEMLKLDVAFKRSDCFFWVAPLRMSTSSNARWDATIRRPPSAGSVSEKDAPSAVRLHNG